MSLAGRFLIFDVLNTNMPPMVKMTIPEPSIRGAAKKQFIAQYEGVQNTTGG